MNRHLLDLLETNGIKFECISKADKVRLSARWTSMFPGLCAQARDGISSSDVAIDNEADALVATRPAGPIYLLPNDDSAMPSVRCSATTVPDLTMLLSDTFTPCDEIIVLDEAFTWSCVVVNHGASGVGRYATLAGS